MKGIRRLEATAGLRILGLIWLAILLLCTFDAQAQVWQPSGGETFRSVAFGEGNYWIVAEQGAMLKSADGLHWESVRHPLNDNSILFFGNGRALACGPRQEMERSSDGGNSWHLVQTVSQYGLGCLASAGETSDTIVACGGFGTIERSTDGGFSWSSIVSGDDSLILSVVFANKRIGYCSTLDGVILKSEDAGFSWKKIALSGAHQLWSVTSIGDSIILAGDNYGRIFKSINAGITWDSLSLTPSIQIAKMYYAYGKCYALGADPTNRLWYSSNDTGQTWQYTQDTTVAELWLFGMVMRDSLEGIRSGVFGVIERTTDGGKNWKTTAQSWMHDRPFIAMRYTSVHFSDSLTGMVFGNDARQLTTTNGGLTWLNQLTDPHQVYRPDIMDAHFFGRDTGLAVGTLGGCFTTTDAGTSWTTNWQFKNLNLWSIGSGSRRGTFMVGDSILWLSTDQGISWSNDSVFRGMNLGWINFPSPDTGYLECTHGIWPNISNNLLWSLDGGRNWATITSWAPNSHTLCLRNAQEGFASLGGGTLIHTTDCFRHWDTLQRQPGRLFYDMNMLSDSVGFLCGDSLLIYSTKDGWKTWQRDSVNIVLPSSEQRATETLRRMTHVGHTVFAVGDENIFKLDLNPPPPMSVSSQARPSNPYLYVQVTPNPSSSHSTIIVYGLYSIAEGPQSLVVRDVLGRQVMDLTPQFLHNSNGSWSAIDVDLLGIPSGAYLVVYESTRAAKSGTMVVLH